MVTMDVKKGKADVTDIQEMIGKFSLDIVTCQKILLHYMISVNPCGDVPTGTGSGSEGPTGTGSGSGGPTVTEPCEVSSPGGCLLSFCYTYRTTQWDGVYRY